MYHYVYQITNLLNDMIYVGKRAIKKYGKENFKKEIIAIVDTVVEAEEELYLDK